MLSYKVWMKLTDAGALHRRSAALKRVDRAIEGYWKAPSEGKRREVSRHLAAWKATKGARWKSSIRNQKGGLDRLEKSLQKRTLTAADETGFEAIRESQQAAADQLFAGQKVTLRNSKLQEGNQIANEVLSTVRHGRSWTDTAHDSSFVRQGLQKLVGDWMTVPGAPSMTTLERDFAERVVGSSIPIFSVVADAGTALFRIGQATRSQYRRYQSAKAGDALREGQPREALRAVLRIIERERNEQATKAATSLVSGAVRTALASVPTGQFAVGAVKSAVELFHHVYLLGRDLRERHAANKILSSGCSIPFSVIEVCPILGCHFLSCLPTSHVVNLALHDIGTDGFMTEVESMRKRIDPAIQQAHRLIQEHSLEMPGLAHRKGGLGQLSSAQSRQLAQRAEVKKNVFERGWDWTAEKGEKGVEWAQKQKRQKFDKIKTIYNVCTLS